MRILAICACLGMTGVFGACGSATEAPALPTSAQQFEPPPIYATWWSMVQECSGTSGSLQQVTWYRVPGVSFITFTVDGTTRLATGYWSSAGNRIVLAGQRIHEGQPVRHEMLHALIRSAGHSREAFLRRCAGVVSCGTSCIADAEPPRSPDPAAPRVGSSALEVDYTLLPSQPAASANDGFFAVILHARNPAGHAVVVELSPLTAQLPWRTFWYDIRQSENVRHSNGVTTIDAEALMFGPGETKRQVFDFRIGERAGEVPLAAGDYFIRGGYDVTFTELRPVTFGN